VSGDEYAVPELLRAARFVPRQAPGRREPARVTSGAFRARGVPVPQDKRQWNAYRLSAGIGWEWSSGIDRHVRRRGAELLGGRTYLCVDCDTALAVDGSVWVDGFRKLADLAIEAGSFLDLTGCVCVRTPGHDSHGPGWHLWWRADPDHPVRTGPLRQCPLVEIKSRCTAPASPGYVVRSKPEDGLDVLPRWLADLAGPPRSPAAAVPGRRDSGRVTERLEGLVSFLLDAGPGDMRNARLYWCACRCAEMVAAGELNQAAAERMLFRAADENGHVAKHGAPATRATIASGLRTAVAA
jgi:hypothetical protein